MRCLMLCFFFMSSLLVAAPQAIYLTLTEDPAHSMSIHWIEKKQKGSFNALFFQKKGDSFWKKLPLTSEEYLGASYFIKTLLISDLNPETAYVFRFEGDKTSYFFSTLPAQLERPLTFAVGGDLMDSFSLYRKMNRAVSQKNPDFIVLGGDIAYSSGSWMTRGKHGSIKKWVTFFTEWHKTTKTKEGRMIPMVALIGNHDVTSYDRKEKGGNALFFKFFPLMQGRSYQSLEIAGAISLFLLDSGHLFPVDSKQTDWLERALQENRTSWKFPIYHVGAYPSIYSPDTRVPKQIRKYWVPLFEKYGVKLAFENHNHAFKRTYPLLQDKIDSKGIVYVGDGGYGAPPRKIREQPYLETAKSTNSFSLVSVEINNLKVESFNNKNELIDCFEIRN